MRDQYSRFALKFAHFFGSIAVESDGEQARKGDGADGDSSLEEDLISSTAQAEAVT